MCAMRLCLMAALSASVAATSGRVATCLSQLQVRGTEEQRQQDAWLTNSGNARSEQLHVLPTEHLTK